MNDLVNFDFFVYPTNKYKRAVEANCPQHYEESKRNNDHVAKEERSLHKSKHGTALKIIEEAIYIYEKSSGATTEHATPPPPVVLNG